MMLVPQPWLPPTQRSRPVNVLQEIVQDQLRTDLPEITPGDTVKVAAKVDTGATATASGCAPIRAGTTSADIAWP